MRRFERLTYAFLLACLASTALAQDAAPDAAASAIAEPTDAATDAGTEVEIPAEPQPADAEAAPDEEVAAGEPIADDAEEVAAAGTDWGGLIDRAPAFFALLHRAAVHMPIALWMLGAFFVLVGVVVPSWRNQVPLACLIGGMLTGIPAAATGWWNAEHEYGDGDWAFSELTDQERMAEVLVQHRWLAVGLVLASIVLTVIALISQRKNSRSLGAVWRVGLLALAAGVAWEGHLGGEVSLGEGYLEEAYQEWVTPEE